MKPDLRCYHHPEREAVNQCDRCGDYLCAECVREFQEQYLCGKCYLQCKHHPWRKSVTQCDHCGDYLCQWCVVPLRNERLCHKCFECRTDEETLWTWDKYVARAVVAGLLSVIVLACIVLSVIAYDLICVRLSVD